MPAVQPSDEGTKRGVRPLHRLNEDRMLPQKPTAITGEHITTLGDRFIRRDQRRTHTGFQPRDRRVFRRWDGSTVAER